MKNNSVKIEFSGIQKKASNLKLFKKHPKINKAKFTI